MQAYSERGKLVIKNGWVICPMCGKGKLLPVLADSTCFHIPRKCKRCGQETIVNIEAPEPASKVTSA